MKKFLTPIILSIPIFILMFAIGFKNVMDNGQKITAYEYYVQSYGEITYGLWLTMRFGDALFITGILLFCFTGLMVVERGGIFDALTYAGKKFSNSLFKKEKGDMPNNIYEYKEIKALKAKAPLLPWVIVAGGITVLSLILSFIVIFAK